MKKIYLLLLASMSIACSNQTEELLETNTTQENVVDFSSRKELVDLGDGFFAEKVDDIYILEGDMLFDEESLLSYIEGQKESRDTLSLQTRSFALKKTTPWPNRIVYYTFNSNVSSDYQQQILSAMAEWERATLIRFSRRTNQKQYVEFILIDDSKAGGYSSVGMQKNKQEIKISRNFSINTVRGTALHEIGHTVGLQHTHQAIDRDLYVKILYENIDSKFKYAFDVIKGDGHIGWGGFDYFSIMLYHNKAFSTNGKHTITKKDGSLFDAQSNHVSDGDARVVRQIYGIYGIVIP